MIYTVEFTDEEIDAVLSALKLYRVCNDYNAEKTEVIDDAIKQIFKSKRSNEQ